MTVAAALVRLGVFGAAGLLVGVVHFGALNLNTTLYLARGDRKRALGLHVLRMTLTVAAWIVIARFGAVALVAAFGGLLVARRSATARAVRALHGGRSRIQGTS